MRLRHILHRLYFQHSIKYRLLFWFLLFSLLPLSIVGYSAYSTASKTLKANSEEKMTRMVIDNLDKIDRNLLERFEAIQIWSTLESSKAAVQIGAGVGGASEFVNYLVTTYRFYTLMMLLDHEGTCVTINTINHANEPIPTEEMFLGKNFRHEAWFSEAIKSDNGAAVITDWHRINVLETLAARTGQKPESAYSIVFSCAIRDSDGTRLGVWATFMNWESIQEILDRIQTEIPEATTSTISLLLLSDNNTIIAYSGISPEHDGTLYGKSLGTDLQQPRLGEIISNAEGVLTYSWNGKPKTIVVSREKGYERYPGKNWKYLLVSDNESAYAQVLSLRSKILLIGVLFALVIILLAYVIGNRITAPLVLVSDTAGAIANGDLSWRIAMTLPQVNSNHSRNEIDLLLQSFKQMTENLQHLIRQIQNAGIRVRESSGQIAVALQQLSEVSGYQSSAILQTTSTVEEFVATSREIVKSTDTIADFAENTEQEARKGVSAAVDTLTQIQEIKQANDQNMQYVAFLNECSQEINKIVEVITTIADNTELIAFNAALEAAGAGEKGRRFGVVAGEIRRLATTVATSVKSIEQKTSEIQRGMKTLVNSFETETQKIEEGVQDMKVTATSFEAILEKIEKTTTSLMQISAATKQQQTSNEQIVSVLQNMSQEIIQFQKIAKQTLAITTELTRLADDLLQTVNVFQIGT
jgi:methyl-accepting chemotaxis protein